MLDSKITAKNCAVDPAKTVAAFCICGECDLHVGEWDELGCRSLDDSAAHAFRDGARNLCSAADDSGDADAAVYGCHHRSRGPAAAGDVVGRIASGRNSSGDGAGISPSRAGLGTVLGSGCSGLRLRL